MKKKEMKTNPIKLQRLVLWSVVAALSQASVFAATLNVPSGSYPTIQSAVSAAAPGDTVLVAPGTYNENVTINKNLKLLSSGGSASTTIQGQAASPEQGTLYIVSNTTGVQIGDIGQGFKVIGLDGPPNSERAAIYFQGSHSNTKIIGNNVRADGDEAVLTEFGASISGFVLTDNEFGGQTFVGSTPGGLGFGGQFTDPNVPRQLVILSGGNGGGGHSNITFSNNTITGIAGGTNASNQPQGNYLVTIDANGLVAKNNVFQGFTTRFGASLRARGPNANITFNDFDGGTPFGVEIGFAAAATSHVNENRIVNHAEAGVINNSSSDFVDATCNWWGSSDGPSGAGPGSGDPVGPFVTFTPWLTTPDLNGPCIGGVPPRQIKQALLADLQSLLPTGNKEMDKRLEKAIKDLSNSLDNKYWVDDSHLTSYGKKVFEDEKQTAKELEKIGLPAATVTNAQAALVYADQQLAQTAIQDAMTAMGNPKEIAKAQDSLADAAADLSAGKIDKAIDDYGKAWESARKALK